MQAIGFILKLVQLPQRAPGSHPRTRTRELNHVASLAGVVVFY